MNCQIIDPFHHQQDIACLELASASWCLVTGGFSSGTEKEGETVLNDAIQVKCAGFSVRVRLELTATCVFVLQTLTDWRDGSQDSADASDAGGARPKVMQHTRNTTHKILFLCRDIPNRFLCFRTLRMLRENLEEEAVIMKDVPGWKVKMNSSQSQQLSCPHEVVF